MSKIQGFVSGSYRRVASVGRLAGAVARRWVRQLSRLSPRRAEIWVFGSRGDSFADNPMYFYEFVRSNVPGVVPVWISGDTQLVRCLTESGRTAHPRSSLRGIVTLLRAGVNVYAADPADTSFAFTGGALNVNPYHGLPIKQIEFDIGTAEARRIYHPTTTIQRLRSHTIYAPKWAFQDIIATSSEWAEEQFRRSYQGRVGEFVLGCAPRIAGAIGGSDLPTNIFGRESEILRTISQGDGATLLFAPTWRPYPFDVTEILGDPSDLQSALDESNTTLYVKWHRFANEEYVAGERVVLLPTDVETTAVLAAVDGLITDYSSIGLDAALLDKPVVWAPVDRDRYHALASTDFDLDYDELVRDHRVAAPSELHAVLRDQSWWAWQVPEPVRAQVWGSDPIDRVMTGNMRLAEAIQRAVK